MRAGLLLAAVLALCSGAAAAKDKPARPGAGDRRIAIDERGLWAEADEFERQVKTSKLLIAHPEINAYLRHVTCRTVGEQACAGIRIYLVRIPAMNAAMYPNGMMLVYTGLLLRMHSESELAAILGHEVAHFERRHSLQALRKRRDAMSWAAWMTVASSLTVYPTNFFGTFLADYFSFSRDQEREADLDGLRAMGAGGYRAMSASSVWLHAREEQDAQAAGLGVKSLKDRDYGLFASHPMDAERMTYLAREGQAIERKDAFEGIEEYRTAMAPIWSMLIDDQIKLNDFGASEYILANLARGNWTGPLLFARAELHRAQRNASDLRTAETLYRQAIVRDDAPDGTWRGLGLLLSRIGQDAEARDLLREYLRRRPDAPDRAMLTAMIEGQ